ncbi:hypothetical protein WI36_27510 [Burkholderia ubonensis]|nr:hypothetical protein WI36_27510 [Burkholderia ubonensis]
MRLMSRTTDPVLTFLRRASRHSTSCGVLNSASLRAARFGKSFSNAFSRNVSDRAPALLSETFSMYSRNISPTVCSSPGSRPFCARISVSRFAAHAFASR